MFWTLLLNHHKLEVANPFGQQSHLWRRPNKSRGCRAAQIASLFSHTQTDFTADTFNGSPSGVRFLYSFAVNLLNQDGANWWVSINLSQLWRLSSRIRPLSSPKSRSFSRKRSRQTSRFLIHRSLCMTSGFLALCQTVGFLMLWEKLRELHATNSAADSIYVWYSLITESWFQSTVHRVKRVLPLAQPSKFSFDGARNALQIWLSHLLWDDIYP